MPLSSKWKVSKRIQELAPWQKLLINKKQMAILHRFKKNEFKYSKQQTQLKFEKKKSNNYYKLISLRERPRQKKTGICRNNSRRLSLFFGSNSKLFTISPNKWKQSLFFETRAQFLLIRAFGYSLFSSRQLINHNKIEINGVTISKPCLFCYNGDILSIKKTIKTPEPFTIYSWIKSNPCFIGNHLEINYTTGQIVLLFKPRTFSIPYNVDLDS